MKNEVTLPFFSAYGFQELRQSWLLSRSEFGRLCIIGSSENGRGTPYGVYSDIKQVIADYGMEASEYHAAKRYFTQSDKPKILLIATVKGIKFKYFRLNGEAVLDGSTKIG